MRTFLDVLKFELRLQLTSPMFAGLVLAFFAIHLLTMSQVGIHLSDNQQIAYNSAFLIFQTELVLGVFGMAPAIIFVVGAAARDHALGTSELFYTTPAPRLSFLAGRFSAGALGALLVGLAGVLGTLAGSFMPWLDPDRVAAFAWQPYAVVYATLVAPNLLVFTAFAFGLAALSRGPVLSYAMALAFVVIGLILNTMALDGPGWLSLLDPFGGLPIQRLTRFWTVTELNTVLPVAQLGPNRLLWLGLAALALTLTALRFRLEYAAGGAPLLGELSGGRSPPRLRGTGTLERGLTDQGKQGFQSPSVKAFGLTAPPEGEHLRRQGTFGLRDTAAQFASQWRMDLRGVLGSPLFWLVIAMTVVSTANQISADVSALMDMPLHPVTSQMLDFVRYGMIQYVLIVIIFYSGILMHREREHRLHEIVGAAPYPDWLPLVSKILTLCTVVMLLLVASVLTSIGWQAFHGQFDFEPMVYLLNVFVFSGFHFCMLAVLACLLQLLAPEKWSGMLLVVAAMVVLMAMEPAGFEHLLYGFRIPYVVYTDMNGFGHFLTPTLSLMAYWGAFCILLIVAGHLIHPRGAEASLPARLREARIRFTPAVRRVAMVAGALVLLTGGWVFYNTNILNDYQTAASRLQAKADYERRYGPYKDLPMPAMTAIDVAIELYPKERRLQTTGRAALRNTTTAPLSQVFITADPRFSLEKLAVEGAILTREDRRQGVFMFKFATPLAPGAETALTWAGTRSNRGFVNSGADNSIVENGTSFILTSVMPRPVYDSERELTGASERRRAGLPPAPRLPALGDPAWLNRKGHGTASLVDFKVVFGTDADQIAVASGTLKRAWRTAGRRYFEYEMAIPTPPALALSSARYAVARDRWNGVDVEVYYDRKHSWNVPTMLETSKTALAYLSREYAPYPLTFFRIVEFPGYRNQAQAHAGMITYSETVGFLNDLTGWAPLDYTTIHELAHQWWGGMAYGARMQGRQILNEGLAQYSTFMIFKQQENPLWIRRILAQTHNAYLAARGEEDVAEQPVIRSEDQGYISYNKAPLAMYALQSLIGEDKVNQALRAYLARFNMQGPPYPTSLDLVAELRAVAGPEHQGLITDLFEKIMLYDVEMTGVSVRRVGAEYEVTMDITARQFEADGLGKETEVPLDTWFEVVLFPESQRELLALTPLYQAHHKLHGGKQRITVRLTAKPGAAGVDPFHLMIDRTPQDNVKRLL